MSDIQLVPNEVEDGGAEDDCQHEESKDASDSERVGTSISSLPKGKSFADRPHGKNAGYKNAQCLKDPI